MKKMVLIIFLIRVHNATVQHIINMGNVGVAVVGDVPPATRR